MHPIRWLPVLWSPSPPPHPPPHTCSLSTQHNRRLHPIDPILAHLCLWRLRRSKPPPGCRSHCTAVSHPHQDSASLAPYLRRASTMLVPRLCRAYTSVSHRRSCTPVEPLHRPPRALDGYPFVGLPIWVGDAIYFVCQRRPRSPPPHRHLELTLCRAPHPPREASSR
jgi:hypothetical protein